MGHKDEIFNTSGPEVGRRLHNLAVREMFMMFFRVIRDVDVFWSHSLFVKLGDIE